MASLDSAREKVAGVFGLSGQHRPRRRSPADLETTLLASQEHFFSPFDVEDKIRASRLAEEFFRIADRAREEVEGIETAARLAEEMKRTQDPLLIEHAFGIFLTHHPAGSLAPLPSLLRRTAFAIEAAVSLPSMTLESGATGEEARMDWFREDPLANEHHEHWHLVYNNFPGAGDALKERHGELFYYMHQQMLARYDIERLALDMPPVEPLSDYAATIGEGYDPGRLSLSLNGAAGFTARSAGATMQPYQSPGRQVYRPEDHARLRDLLRGDIAQGRLVGAMGDRPLRGAGGSDILGDAQEPTAASVNSPRYQNHHGMGHALISAASSNGRGVMSLPATAIRDPAFWRWHRHIDDMHFAYQDSLEPHDFSDAPSGATIQRVLFGLKRDHVGLEDGGAAALQAAAEAVADGSGVAEALETRMETGRYTLLSGNSYRYDYLRPEPFFVGYVLSNTTEAPIEVTLRLFLIPAVLFDVEADPGRVDGRLMRRYAIEMDKVGYSLRPGVQAFGRVDTAFSVIRRPAVTDPAEVADLNGAQEGSDARTCTCGWPYGLLLPRGRGEGMPFQVFAMLTDNTLDRVGPPRSCGSMSFCGVGDSYPDRRPMGYPFDRVLARPLRELVAASPAMFMAPIAIRWSNSPSA